MTIGQDLAGGVRSGSGRRERKERKDCNKPRRPLLQPMQLRVPKGSEGKEQVNPVMLSADTPASIVVVPYRTWFTTVTTGTSAWGPGDSRFDPVTAGTL
ncbi:hypothetical protein PIB30_074459 [Stylosanthes scabra]|uniref:Uncharacterized protein n=1 Tax=Stylosanthes scabra TaxID=79078 RepID=A0ABU6TPA4_9FABA|nr:hypothetical protein [Stylosanthes scabra]